jgi:hypothetical protein
MKICLSLYGTHGGEDYEQHRITNLDVILPVGTIIEMDDSDIVYGYELRVVSIYYDMEVEVTRLHVKIVTENISCPINQLIGDLMKSQCWCGYNDIRAWCGK